ncbi:hypothetical protein CEXT_545171 [Caerostris extrusa]|uniref:Uncharacterized protein n=1 Tax=Caerostris extrusa TaxID=172846 RepID=A0AAV4M9Z8_CAEEX|nr:hypothetical protein CEXT_545171 [Caerostris extrusa]
MLLNKVKTESSPTCKWFSDVNATFHSTCSKPNAFNLIFSAGLLFGLPLSSSIIKEKKDDIGRAAKSVVLHTYSHQNHSVLSQFNLYTSICANHIHETCVLWLQCMWIHNAALAFQNSKEDV